MGRSHPSTESLQAKVACHMYRCDRELARYSASHWALCAQHFLHTCSAICLGRLCGNTCALGTHAPCTFFVHVVQLQQKRDLHHCCLF